jgi:hypothetical protein
MKHGRSEKYGFSSHDYLGTSVPLSQVLDAAEGTGANGAHFGDRYASRRPRNHYAAAA